MERLTGLDASFLYFETPSMHLHVCAAVVLDPSTMPGGYSFDKIRENVRDRLHLVPPFRRKLASVPFNLDHPVWVDDDSFDLDYHLRRIGCPSPGTEEQLAELTADIAGRPLDRSRPLWELWIVEGLENNHIGMIAKMHHATIDGVSGANLMVHLLDLEPDPAPRAEPEAWHPERKPSEVGLVARALVGKATWPIQLMKIVPSTVRSVAGLVKARRGRSGPGMPAPLTAPRTSFNTSLTPHRKVAFARLPLDDVKLVKNTFGVKVNDVVQAIASGALRRYLEARGELPTRSLIAVCPISVHGGEADQGKGANRVSAMFCSLFSNIEDPVERMRKIAEGNKGAKEEHQAIGAAALQQWAEFAMPTTFSLAARMYSRLRLADRHPVVHNLVISNVPGPPIPLYMAGARSVGFYPLGPIFDGATLNVTVVSYQDQLNWGFISCRETTPGLWHLAAAVHESLAELVKAAKAEKAEARA
jgi:WS/DGAT/MGAT family acyltransferase